MSSLIPKKYKKQPYPKHLPQSALHDRVKGTKKDLKKQQQKRGDSVEQQGKRNMGQSQAGGKDLNASLLKLSLGLPAQFHLLQTKMDSTAVTVLQQKEVHSLFVFFFW